MDKRSFWFFITLVSLLMVLVLIFSGCSGEASLEGTAKQGVEEKPDKELFDKYFSDITLGGIKKDGVNIFLPYFQETWVGLEFKNMGNFTFRIAVLNLKTNNFVKRCDMTVPAEGSDGLVMEALEWAFLGPGNYEYRVYLEDTLVAILPFKVLSFLDCLRFGDFK